jgi:hypothetical protein
MTDFGIFRVGLKFFLHFLPQMTCQMSGFLLKATHVQKTGRHHRQRGMDFALRLAENRSSNRYSSASQRRAPIAGRSFIAPPSIMP